MRQADLEVCALDTETHLIEPGKLAPTLVCVSYCDGEKTGLLHRNEIESQIENLLKNRNIKIVGHNIAFDMGVLAQNDLKLIPHIFQAYDEGRIEDTQIREQLLDIARGCFRGVYRDPDNKKHRREYSLASISKRELGVELEKDDWRLRYAELTDVSICDWPEGAKDYSRLDAQITHQIFMHQEEAAKKYEHYSPGYIGGSLLSDSAAQARAAFALHLFSCRGVITDRSHVENLESSIVDTMETAKANMKSHGLLHPNGTKNLKVIRSQIENCLGDKAPRTAKGSIKTDDQTLMKCDHPGLDSLKEFKAAEKLNSTWMKYLKLGITKPIQPYYNVLVETGRTSCRSPNLQNPHRAQGLRECFIPRPGFYFAACDYTALEMCTLAQVCIWLFGGSNLAAAINDGIDPHLKLAAQILGLTYDQAYEDFCIGDNKIREMRQLAKAANFGYPGGMGADAFRTYAAGYGVKLSLPQSENLRRDWFEAWPEMRKYFDHISSITKSPDQTLKQFVSNRHRGGIRFTSACNSYFQGLAADGAKAATYNVVRKCYSDSTSDLYGTRPIMFIHDEIIAEVPKRDAAKAAEELSKTMRESMQVYTPDVKIKTSVALMDRWYKNADESRNENGELILWEG